MLVPIHDLIFWPLSCKLRAYEEDSFFGGGIWYISLQGFRLSRWGFKKSKIKTYVNSRSGRHWGWSVGSCRASRILVGKRSIRRQSINYQLVVIGPSLGVRRRWKGLLVGLMRCVVCKDSRFWWRVVKVGRYRVLWVYFFLPAERPNGLWQNWGVFNGGATFLQLT